MCNFFMWEKSFALNDMLNLVTVQSMPDWCNNNMRKKFNFIQKKKCN